MPSELPDFLFRDMEGEPTEQSCAVVEGALPVELRGTLLRNGVGLWNAGSDPLNFFDANGMVAALSIADGRASLRARNVRTAILAEEQAAGRMMKRRVFTNLPRRWKNFLNIDVASNAAHDVTYFAGRLVATFDPGHFALDPQTLDTRGEETWHGQIERGNQVAPMPHVDGATNRLVVYQVRPGKTKPDQIRFFEVNEQHAVASESAWQTLLASPGLTHDVKATKNFYVVTEAGMRLRAGMALWGAKTIFESLHQPSGTTAHLSLFSRPDAANVIRVPIPDRIGWAFHIANAFERGDELVADVITYNKSINFLALAPRALRERAGIQSRPSAIPTFMRMTVDTKTGALVSAVRAEGAPLEAPAINPLYAGKPHRYVYGASSLHPGDRADPGGYFSYNGIARLDTDALPGETWAAYGGSTDEYLSPPAFAPRAGGTAEDDGWLLAWAIDSKRETCSVIVLDARDLERGPVARIQLSSFLPLVSHVRWTNDVIAAG